MNKMMSTLLITAFLLTSAISASSQTVVYYSGDQKMGSLRVDSVDCAGDRLSLTVKNRWSDEAPAFQDYQLSFPVKPDPKGECFLAKAVRQAKKVSVFFYDPRHHQTENTLVWEVGKKRFALKASEISDETLQEYTRLEDNILEAESALKEVLRTITNPDLSYCDESSFLFFARKTGFALESFHFDLRSALDEFLVDYPSLIVSSSELAASAAGRQEAFRIWKKHFFEWLDVHWIEHREDNTAMTAKFWIVDPNDPAKQTKDLGTVRRYLDQYESKNLLPK